MHKPRMTLRRLKILRLIAQGYNNSQIAKAMKMTLSNTKLQKSRLYAYFSVHSAKDVVLCALKERMLPYDIVIDKFRAFIQ